MQQVGRSATATPHLCQAHTATSPNGFHPAEFQYRNAPNRKVLITGRVTYATILLFFAYSLTQQLHKNKLFNAFCYPHFCRWGEAASLLKSAAKASCTWQLKGSLPCQKLPPQGRDGRGQYLVASQPLQLVLWHPKFSLALSIPDRTTRCCGITQQPCKACYFLTSIQGERKKQLRLCCIES